MIFSFCLNVWLGLLLLGIANIALPDFLSVCKAKGGKFCKKREKGISRRRELCYHKKQRTDVGGETRGEADMEKIKKNLGFGFMRLPMQGEEVDLAQTQQMVDAFLAAGFNYFDTAHEIGRAHV